jgi:hypothetical protein
MEFAYAELLWFACRRAHLILSASFLHRVRWAPIRLRSRHLLREKRRLRLPPAQPAQYSCVCNDCDRETWWQKLGLDKWRRGSASNTNDRNLASTPSTKPHTSHVDTMKKTMPRSVVVVFFFPSFLKFESPQLVSSRHIAGVQRKAGQENGRRSAG